MIVLFRDKESEEAEGLPCKRIDVDLEEGFITVWDSEGDRVLLDKARAYFYAICREEDIEDATDYGEG